MKMHEYLKDDQGRPSSTRLFSWKLIQLTLWLVPSTVIGLMGLSALLQDKETILIIWLSAGVFTMITNIVILLFAFLGKNAAKKIELEPFVELAKKGIDKL